MPIFTIRRIVEYEANIEAPTAELAIAQTKDWSDSEWGWSPEVDVFSTGSPPAGTRPDYTADLRGQEHEHDFDDEDTGGCIYCDAPALNKVEPS